MDSVPFAASDAPLAVESARRTLFLWLYAAREERPFTVTPANGDRATPWRDELEWLGVDGASEGDGSPVPDWLQNLPPVLDAEPTPWGEWGGRTSIAELRELGVLPEALLNFLALLGWEPTAGAAARKEDEEELLSRDHLLQQWSPEQLSDTAPRFDFECLRRLNHAWLQRADLDRLLDLALPYYQRIDWMPDEPAPSQRLWLRALIKAVLPGLDFLSLLPPRTRLVFAYQPENYLRVPESREAMEREGARDVLRLFSQKALEDSWLTPERYRKILEELKHETPWRGRNLIQPVRVLLTGLPFGPDLDELLPLIEQGAELDLPVRIKSCRERVVEFCSVFV